MKKIKRISFILTSLVGTMIVTGCSINVDNTSTSSNTLVPTTSEITPTSDETSKYNFKEFKWADDFSSASLILTNGKEELRISATISTNSLSPSCDKEGSITYVATATYEGTEYSDTKTKTIDKLNHDYDINNIIWDWATDYSSASAKIKCKNCNDEKNIAATINTETVDATATADGKIKYIATINYENNTYTDTKEKIIPATGYIYDYENISYVWNNDYTSVDVTVPCTNASNADLKLKTTDIIELSRNNSTCSVKGNVKYRASITIGENVYTNDKEVELDLLSHDYDFNNIIWDWATDYSTATATIKCKNCDDEKVLTANISVNTINPTITDAGKSVYTATINFENNTYTDTKEKIIPATGYIYDYNNISYVWNNDNTNVVITVPCTNASNADLVYNSNNIIELSRTESSCSLKGKIIYQVSIVLNEITYTNNKEVELPLADHDYDDPIYTWNSDHSRCNATRICKNNSSHKEIEEAFSSYQIITPATFSLDGLGRYSVTFNNPAFEAQTYDVIIPKSSYSYNEPTYEWNNDYTKLTATRVAKEDSNVKETETVDVSYSVKTPASCKANGVGVYTSANFTNPAFSKQTKEVTIPKLDHEYDYDNLIWVWNGYESCELQIKCKNCDDKLTYSATITSSSTATCEAAGIITYTAKVVVGTNTYTDIKQINDPAKGHIYGTPTYSWNGDYSKCTATAVCLNDSSHKLTETVNVTPDILLATKTTTGYKKYVATFNNSKFSTQEMIINLYYLEFQDIDGNVIQVSDAGKVVTSGGKEQIFNNVEENNNVLTIDDYNTVAKINSKPRISTSSNPQLTYVFRGWLDGDTLITNINNYKVTKNTILKPKYIKYEIIKTIDASCKVGGLLSDTYNYNNTAGIDIQTVYDGYVFEGIYKIVNGSRTKIHTPTDSKGYEQIKLDSEYDTTYEINYIPMPISISTDGLGSVEYTKTSWVGGKFEASAVTTKGYSFMGFYDSNNNLAFKNSNGLALDSFSITLNADLESKEYIAKWVKSNIAVSVSDETSGALDGYNGTSIFGETKTITAVPATGYTFVCWKKDGSQISTSPTINITFDNSTASYVAEFKSYTVTLSTNDLSAGTIPNYNNKKFEVGSTVTLNIDMNEGYTFLGWYDDLNNLIPGTKGNLSYSFTMPKADINYKAIFEKYTLTTTNLNPEYGTIETPYSYTPVTAGSMVTLTVTPNKGYTFLGWYYNDELLTNSNISSYMFTMPEDNIEYKAKFIAYTIEANSNYSDRGTVIGYSESNMATVTFNSLGGSSIPSQTITVDSPITYPALPLKEGYVFNGWYKDLECTEEFDFTSTIESNMMLYAGYKKMLTDNVNESFVIDIARDYKSQSTSYSLSLASTSETNKNNVYFTSYIDGKIKLYFRSPSYETVYANIINLTTGKTLSNQNISNPNFSNVYTEISVNKYDVICLSCYANNDCNLGLYAVGNELPEASGVCGYISYNNPTNITAGNLITLKAIEKPGYTFNGWYINGEASPVSTSNTLEYTMLNQNVVFEAKFTYYTVSLDATYKNNDLSAGSLINEYNNTKVTVGDKVELKATLNEGYTFLGWFINGNELPISTNLEYDYIMPKENVSIVAKYTYYLVTIETNNINAGNVGGVSDGNYVIVSFNTNGANEVYDNQIVKTNTTITYPGNPTKTGYIFKGWYKNSICTEFFDFDAELVENTTIYAGYYQIPTTNYETLDLTNEAYSAETAHTVVGQGGGIDTSHYSYFVATSDTTYKIFYKNSSDSSSYRTSLTIYNVTTNVKYIQDNKGNINYNFIDISVNKGDIIYIQTYSFEGNDPIFSFYINELTSNNTTERILDPTPTMLCGPIKYNNTKIKAGTEITLTATLNSGYTFDGWYQYNDTTGQYDIKLTSNLTYKIVVGEKDIVKYKAIYQTE